MRAFCYCRVSRAEQQRSDESQSISTQRRLLESYCARVGLEVADWFVDDGVSGAVPLARRPGGKKMLERLGEVDAVVALKLDRAFRDNLDAVSTERVMAKAGVGLHLCDLGDGEPVDTGTATGALKFNMLASVAQFERQRIGERIRENKASRRAAGKVYAVPQYGYRHVDGAVVPDKSEQKVIMLIGKMRRRGFGYAAIAKELNVNKIPTKTGAIWHASTVRNVLLRAHGSEDKSDT